MAHFPSSPYKILPHSDSSPWNSKSRRSKKDNFCSLWNESVLISSAEREREKERVSVRSQQQWIPRSYRREREAGKAGTERSRFLSPSKRGSSFLWAGSLGIWKRDGMHGVRVPGLRSISPLSSNILPLRYSFIASEIRNYCFCFVFCWCIYLGYWENEGRLTKCSVRFYDLVPILISLKFLWK